MRKYFLFVLMFVLVGVLILVQVLIINHNKANTPPNIDTAQHYLAENRSNMQIIIEYMIEQECQNIYILDSNGRILADLEEMQIDDPGVCAALDYLISNKIYIDISKMGNTIEFQLWQGNIDIGCGIAYSIDGVHTPEIQFMTHIEPLAESNWFYYVYDYNTWRTEKSMGSTD